MIHEIGLIGVFKEMNKDFYEQWFLPIRKRQITN
jgi:hypothetical protein